MVERAHLSLFEMPYFVIFRKVIEFDYCFATCFFSSGHFALLSRHFPAARKNASRISGSGMRSASLRSGIACLSGAMKVISWGAIWSCGIRLGLITYSIVVTVGAPSRELTLNKACPLILFICVRQVSSATATIRVFLSSLMGVVALRTWLPTAAAHAAKTACSRASSDSPAWRSNCGSNLSRFVNINGDGVDDSCVPSTGKHRLMFNLWPVGREIKIVAVRGGVALNAPGGCFHMAVPLNGICGVLATWPVTVLALHVREFRRSYQRLETALLESDDVAANALVIELVILTLERCHGVGVGGLIPYGLRFRVAGGAGFDSDEGRFKACVLEDGLSARLRVYLLLVREFGVRLCDHLERARVIGDVRVKPDVAVDLIFDRAIAFKVVAQFTQVLRLVIGVGDCGAIKVLGLVRAVDLARAYNRVYLGIFARQPLRLILRHVGECDYEIYLLLQLRDDLFS